MRSALITGVSSGIGAATASVLLHAGWRIFGSVRRAADAEPLQREWGAAFVPLTFDVADAVGIEAAAARTRELLHGETLGGLVNNAGIALSEPLLIQSLADFRRQVEVNLVGLFAVIRAFAPLLGVDSDLTGPRGRIVNISSVGGRMGPPFLGAYAASKHGVEGLSESLRRELRMFGIEVVVVAPGSVATPIWDKAENAYPDHLAGTPWARPFRAFSDYMLKEGRRGYSPARIALVVHEALTASRPRLRYAPVAGKLMNWTLPNLLPPRLVDWLISRRLGLDAR